jgi:hypothetical protein
MLNFSVVFLSVSPSLILRPNSTWNERSSDIGADCVGAGLSQ